MSEISTITLSIFALIGIGYAAARTGLLQEKVGSALAEFVFIIPIPVLLFRTLANADFAGAAPWALWTAYFSGVAVTWALSHLLIRRLFGRDARSGVVAGVSASFANTVLIAIPLVQTVVGDQGMVALLVILSVHLPVMMLASLLLYEWALRADGIHTGALDAADILKRFVGGLARNPIVIGILAGGLWRLSGLPLTGVLGRIVDSLAQVAGPLALFAAGMGLARYGIARNVPQSLVITALKLVVMPAVVLGMGLLLELPPVFLVAAVVTAACPTGVNAYLIATRFGTGQAVSSNAMTISTALGAFTTGIWLAIGRMF
jgi:predicted permease